MSENYFYSSLSAQEIESTLVGAVVFNNSQSLTTSQKEQARQNIGAGGSDTKIIIMGFYDTLAELQSQIPVGSAGDVYAVGTTSPYNLYIWDAIGNTWKNNGAITFSDAVIDDEDIALDSTWSSQKINTQLGGKQAAISAVGMLKGTGSSVQAATLGSDYTAVDDTLDSSTEKTYSIDKIKSLEPTGIVHYDQAQTLTDAQKAQARTNIVAERSWTLVWTNDSPTSNFASQDVLIDLSAYSEVRVDFYSDTSANYLATNSGAPCEVGKGGFALHFYMIPNGATQFYQRSFLTYANKVHFYDCNQRNTNATGSLATSNNACIPYRIYAR